MRALVALAAAFTASRPESLARGAVVDAGTLTNVAVEGSSSEGILSGELTRDGDAETSNSRWSCEPSGGRACSITYTFADPLALVGLKIALHEGATRTSLVDIFVDGNLQSNWTSSGTTSAFEDVEVGVVGREIELRSSEGLSIYEVEILVDDDGLTEFEAGTTTTVMTTTVFYDPNLGSFGCRPDECTAALTRDGEESANASKWACSSARGGMCSISYDLGAFRYLSHLRIALHKGSEIKRTLQVYVDDVLAATWTSSGDTPGFESIDLSGSSGFVVVVTAVLADMEWIGINETEIMVLWNDGILQDRTTPTPGSGTAPTPAPAPAAGVATPAPAGVPDSPTSPPATTGTPSSVLVEVGTVATVTATAALYDQNLADENGCDPSGCGAGLTRDGDTSPGSRWSCAPILGVGGGSCSISYDLGAAFVVADLRLAMYEGPTRTRKMSVHVDGVLATTWTSSGTTGAFEKIDLPAGTSGAVVEITGVLADEEWLSIVETQIMVLVDESDGNLQTVGPLPLAWDRSFDYTNAWHIKDGDMTTSWSCTGDPASTAAEDELELSYECSVGFDLFYYRHIRQVKIGEQLHHTLVADDGSTDRFETHTFDAFTNYVTISAVFKNPGESISISEVEFIEEVQAGQVSVVDFDPPYDNGDGLWTSSAFSTFDFSSDSDATLDRDMTFDLATYATLSAIELQFPTGDTYKFDLQLYNENRDPFATLAGWESQDSDGWQSFDLVQHLTGDQYVTKIVIVMKGTGSGAPGFKLLDARFMGTPIDNPTTTFWVGSSRIRWWDGDKRYPDSVAEGTGDQRAINAAICAVKKASFDGVDCVGGDDTATGTVKMPMGQWFVDGSIVMKSGVYLDGRYSIDDSPYITDILLEDGATDNRAISAILVADGISDSKISELFIQSAYDPGNTEDASNEADLGPSCISVTNSRNITFRDTDARFCDGDALVVRNSQVVNIDAGQYDDEYQPWTTGRSRGTGLLVDASDSVWVRRHTVYDNGVAGIHIIGSNNFTFEATIADECYGGGCPLEGEGNVGSVDGQQPIEVIIETSTDVKFTDMKVQSSNDPVMTISSSSAVSFSNCGFSNIESGACVIQFDELSDVTVDDDSELTLFVSSATVSGDLQLGPEGQCYVKA